MNILVLDVAAKNGGALSILNSYYENLSKDVNNLYYFCVCDVELKTNNNIKVIKYPWVAKNWINRIYFEFFVANRIVEKYNIKKVISLQNIGIFGCKCEQELYIHQAIPFSDYSFSLLKNPKLWFYYKIYPFLIGISIKKASKVFVQTNWMKNAVIKKYDIDAKKIIVITPNFDININRYFDIKKWKNTFIYPSDLYVYKNHETLLKAALELIENNIDNFVIYLTVDKEEIMKKYGQYLEKIEKNIIFCGRLKRNILYKHYEEDILIFPSYIETFGLPLLEAKLHKTYIICANTKFANEVLKNYDKCEYFDYDNYKELAKIMKKYLVK